MENKLTQNNWIRIKEVMTFYNRESGWVEFVNGKIMFFDAKPSFGGWYVTLALVLKQIV